MARTDPAGDASLNGRAPAHPTVAFVCQYYLPEPVTQPRWIVEALRRQGLPVRVLTGVPNYPEGRVQEGYRPWRTSLELVEGVPVRRTPLYPNHDARTALRILNYVSWAVSSAVLGQRLLNDVDVTLVYSSPATAALAAVVARKLRGAPYVLLVQDLWPDSIFASGFMPGRGTSVVRRILKFLSDASYRNATRVIVISPGMIDVMIRRGVPRERLCLIYNWVPRRLSSTSQSADTRNIRMELDISPDDFVLLYAGNHGGAQALDNAVRGMAQFGREDGVHLVLVGDGVEKEGLSELAGTLAPGVVHFVDTMDRETLVAVMDQANAHLVSLAARPLFSVTMPSKLQAIMAEGLPVLCCGDGDMAEVVHDSGAGEVCPPGQPSAFADALLRLVALSPRELASMGQRGREYYEAHMSPEVGAAELVRQLIAASVCTRPNRGSQESEDQIGL